jgi:multidrug efflux pump subunit AcrB
MRTNLTLTGCLMLCVATLIVCGESAAEDSRTSVDRTITVRADLREGSAREIELDVTATLELALITLPNVKSIESVSRDGSSVISLTYGSPRDADEALPAVREALEGATRHLPVVEPQILAFDKSGAQPGLWLMMTTEGLTTEETFAAAEQVEARIQRMVHVDDAQVWGARDSEFVVRCDPQRLAAYRLAIGAVVEAIEAVVAPGRETAERLGQLVVARREDAAVHLRDVAEVRRSPAPLTNLARLDGEPAIVLGVHVSDPAQADEVRDNIVRSLPELAPPGATLSLVFGETSAARPWLIELRGPADVDRKALLRLADRAEAATRPLAKGEILSQWTAEEPFLVRLLLRPKSDMAPGKKLREALVASELPGIQLRMTRAPRGAASWRPRHDVELALSGEDLKQLTKWSAAVAKRLAAADYLDVVNEAPTPSPTVQVTVDRKKMARYGLRIRSLGQAIEAAMQGIVIKSPADDGRDVRIRVGEGEATEKLPSIPIAMADETVVPLSAVADVELESVVHRIERLDLLRVVRVTASLPDGADADAREAARQLAEQELRRLSLGDAYDVELR